jgi:Hemerythrin HHE cation binding domain
MVLMNATTIDLPSAVMGFAGVHLALRAEAAGIAHLVAEGDDHQAHRRAALLCRVLTAHHRTEDTLLWPAIEARQPGFTMTTVELEQQHRELDELMAGLRDDPATIGAAGSFLEQHLQDEEQRALPVWLASFDAADHERFGRLLRRSTPLGEAGTMISWLLDATPATVHSTARAHLPAPFRMAHRFWWRHRYEGRYGRAPLAA